MTSTPTSAERFWCRVDRRGPGECWPWKGAVNNCGYGVVRVGSSSTSAHRVALSLVTPGDGDAMHACHNRICCNPSHLSWGDRRANLQMSAIAGRLSKKLNGTQAAEIIAAARIGERYASIARRFGVDKALVSRIARGLSWSHIGGAS